MLLKELLQTETVDTLRSQAKGLELKGYSKLKKAELVLFLAEYLLDEQTMYQILLLAEDDEIEFLRKVAKAQQPYKENVHPIRMRYFISLGYLYINDECFYVTDDIKDLLHSVDSEDLEKARLAFQYINNYLKASVNLYGIISPSKLQEIYNTYNSNHINDNEVYAFIIRALKREQYFTLYCGLLVHESLLIIDGDLESLIHKQVDKPYYIPSQEEFLSYANNFHFERTIQYETLKKFIYMNYLCNDEEAEELSAEIQSSISMEEDLKGILSEIKHMGTELSGDAKHMAEIIRLFDDIQQNTRLWSNRGHTPLEMSGDKTERRYINEWKASQQKVGRNDPCPCGSGKKYKKCCGRNY